MKIEDGLVRDIMALNIYSMELTPTVRKGMGEFVDFLFGLNRIPQKISPESVFYTKLLKEVDPELVECGGEDRAQVSGRRAARGPV